MCKQPSSLELDLFCNTDMPVLAPSVEALPVASMVTAPVPTVEATPVAVVPTIAERPESAFLSAIMAAGLTPPEFIEPDGTLHRFSSNGKRSDKSGWYVLHLDGVPAGIFGCWRDGLSQTWSSKPDNALTEAEKQAMRQRVRAAQAARDAAKVQAQASAQAEANQHWEAATPAPANHPYLLAKGVQAHGLRRDGHLLLVPMRDADGTLHSLQTIAPNGEKRFLTDGKKKGCFYTLGQPGPVLVICEGFATGASIHEATGLPVAVGFDAYNLLPVAQALRTKYPDTRLILAADNDTTTEGNPGLAKATEAAQAVAGVLALAVSGTTPEKKIDFNDLHQAEGLEAVARLIELAQPVNAGDAVGAAGDAWPELREIKADLPAVPAFDAVTLLPPVLADFVLDEADRMPCSPDFVAASMVVALGSVIGARCALKPKRRDDWIVTPNLYGGIVGLPSQKKTPAANTVMRFLDRLEAKGAELLEEEQRIHAAEMAAFEAHEAAVKAAMKKAASSKEGQIKMDEAMADLQALQEPEEPHARRFKSNDSTVEKLGEILSRNPAGLLVFRDELIGLLSSWEREGHEGDKAFYLEGWNGTGSFSVDRITRGEIRIKNFCLSVFGGIQPDLLERYLSGIANSMDNDGRIQRFQVLVYPDPVLWEWCDRHPVQGAREAVRDLFDRLASFDPVQDGAAPADDFVKLPYFSFDDAAQKLFIEWSQHLNKELMPQEENPLMAQHLGKFEKLFCAVALILHLAEGNIGPVGEESALRAAAWCEYLAAHARRIYGTVEAAKVNTAKTLMRHIGKGKLQEHFSIRDVHRKGWTGLKTAAEAETALIVLEEHGVVRSYEAIADTGRPTVRYQINPKLRGAA